MDSKIEILLNKINIDKENYQYFSDAKITKIIVNKQGTNWNIFISKNDLLPLAILEELENKKMLLDEKAEEIKIIFDIKNPDINIYLSYYPLLLKKLKNELKVLEIYEDCLHIEDNFLTIITSNDIEYEKMVSCKDKIEEFYKLLGYNFNIDIIKRHEDNILEEIKQELENTAITIPPQTDKKEEIKEEKPKEKTYKREPKDPNSIIGRGIKEEPIKIKTLIGEDNNVVIEAQVFGTDYFESSKTDFKIITLKVTDYSDSIYCKVFVRDDEEYSRLCKELKSGNWYKIRGYTKNDQFAKELVLNARDIVKIERAEE